MKLSSVVAILTFSASMVVGSPAGIPQTLQKRCKTERQGCSIFFDDCCDGYRCLSGGSRGSGECVKRRCISTHVELKLTCPADRKPCETVTDCGERRDGWRCQLLPLPKSAGICDITRTTCCENVGCIPKGQSNEFYLQAGLAQGITPRSRFTIHEANIISPKNIPIGTVEVDKVDTFVAHLKISNTLNLPTICYGRQVGRPERALDIYVTEEFVDAAEPSEAWAEVFSGDEEQLVLRPVERDIATVVLSVNAEKQATFTLNHPACVRYGIQTLPAPCFSPIPPSCSRVISVLTALLQWNWHLCRVPDSRPFQKDIDLEFYKLQVTDYSADGSPILTPNSPNLNEHGEFSFVASLDDYYGLRIINRSTQDLYADLFIFSPSTLAIDQKSIPIVDPALLHPIIPKNGHLTIGYGSELEIPFMFLVDPTMGYDITILKLFVSSAPVNFQSLKQSSPFEGGRSLISSNKVQDPINKKDLWDAFTITLIQKQDPKEKE
ncbi:unnamed protein product [Rhizoctonia solani]|uniref:Uncharacterized protein n=1 Tax=Rhizoctonia solani TaxID=456999 RepID=A0A8H3HXA7_9AGAM|nr:unnamed protein product [Rhizoctonia solani]